MSLYVSNWIDCEPFEAVLKDGTVGTVTGWKHAGERVLFHPEDIYRENIDVRTDFIFRINHKLCGEAYVTLPPWAEGAACFVTPEMVKSFTT